MAQQPVFTLHLLQVATVRAETVAVDLDDLVMATRRALVARGRSGDTIRVYLSSIRRSWAWLEAECHTDVLQAPPEALRALSEAQPSRASAALARSAVRAARAAVDAPQAAVGAMRVPSRPKMRCRALEPAQAASLARWAAANPGPDAAALALGLWTGLRRAEIASLRWADLAMAEPAWLTVRGKGGTVADVPLHPRVAALLMHLERRGEHVFPGPGGRGHVTPATIWKWVRAAGEAAGVPGLQTHVLRHTALATANDATGDLRAVQDLARHARPETTAGYTRTSTRRLVAAAMAVDYQEGTA